MNFDNDIIQLTFSERLKKIRKSKDESQGSLAKKIGLNPASVSAYENGANLPSLPIAVKIANHYKVTLDWLCGLDNSKNKIETYADFIDLLNDITSNFTCDFSSHYDEYTGQEIANISIYNDEELVSFFDDLGKMVHSLNNKVIDKEIFDLWIEKRKKEYKDKLIIPF